MNKELEHNYKVCNKENLQIHCIYVLVDDFVVYGKLTFQLFFDRFQQIQPLLQIDK